MCVCHSDEVMREADANPPVTSPLGVRCKRTSVSRLVVKPHSLYRCRLDEHPVLVVLQ